MEPVRGTCRAVRRQGHGLGAAPSSRSPSCDKACCLLNPRPGLRPRDRQTSGEAGAGGASPVGRKLKNYPTLSQMECQPADFGQSRFKRLRPSLFPGDVHIYRTRHACGSEGLSAFRAWCNPIRIHSLGAPMTQEALSGMRSVPNSVDPFCSTFASKAVCFWTVIWLKVYSWLFHTFRIRNEYAHLGACEGAPGMGAHESFGKDPLAVALVVWPGLGTGWRIIGKRERDFLR